MRFQKVSAIALLLISFSTNSVAQIKDSEFIEFVKKTNASDLESGLADAPISQWLENTFEFGKTVNWELNDCGEGGDGRDAPACVELKIPQKNGYYLHISSLVGVTPKNAMIKPKLWMVFFFKSEGYKTLDVITVNTIAEAIRLYKTNLGEKKK